MNYKSCYHRRRIKRHRRCRSQMKLMNITNVILLVLFVSMFVGVLVVQAATLISEDKKMLPGTKLELPPEVTSCKMIQTSDNIYVSTTMAPISTEMKTIKQTEHILEVTPLVIDTPIELENISANEGIVEVIDRTIDEFIGERDFEFEGNTFHGYDMPSVYYPGIDYSFEPYMDYRKITNKSTPAYAVSHSENAYTDEYGLRRYVTGDDQFKVNGQDDYIIALGTYYKERGTCGSRYLIVTTTGMFTIITGDEKADKDTDERNMFSLHADGRCGGIVEWIVDTECLETTMRRTGTITAGPVEALQGEITHIYKIN